MKIDLQLYKNKSFLYFWISTWVTALGDSIFVISLTWMLIEKTGSPSIVGTYLFIIGVSKLLFILIGGVIVDKIHAKQLLIYSNILRAGTIILFLVIISNQNTEIWLFYVIGAVFGIIDAVAEPAGISCRTQIVEKQFYTQSMGLLMTAGNVSAVVGPMIAAGLIAIGSTELAILINAITFIIAATLLTRVKFVYEGEDLEKTANDPMIKSVIAGFQYFIKTPIILVMAVFAFFANAAVGATLISIPFLAKDLGFGVEGFGLMNTSIAIGSVLGGIVLSMISIKNPKPYMTLFTCFLQGLCIVCIGITGNLWLLLFLIASMGFFEAAVNVIAPSVNHMIIPKKLFGRVISVMILVMSGSVPLSQAASGWIMESTGPSEIFIYGGSIEILAAVITFSFPFVRRFGERKVSDDLATK